MSVSHSVIVSGVALTVTENAPPVVALPATERSTKSSSAEASIVSGSMLIPPIELILVSCVKSVGFAPAVSSIP